MDLIERYCSKCGVVCGGSETACTACGASLKTTGHLEEQEDTSISSSLRLAGHLHTRQLFHERYRIARQVGVGGFGAVYEAEDILESRHVAIKEIGLANLNAQQMIEATGSFNREVEMLSSLQHPGIPRMYEQLTDAEHWYLVMEFIVGETLEEMQAQADGGRLPLERVLRIGEQTCDVLGYLHSRQPTVIFRDLKPANIMLTPTGKLYLIDFGVARHYQRSKARDTIAFGSPGYAAPEQYGKAQTTAQADIYSLGALLYCLLSGDDPSEHPFKFSPLHLYGVDGIRELDALIQRMVAFDPVQRPAHIREVNSELQRIQQIYKQSTKRTPIWIPPQSQTPPATFPATGSGQQMQFAPSVAGSQQPARKTTRRRVLTVGLLAGGAVLASGIAITWGSSQSVPANTSSYASGYATGAADAATVAASDATATASDATAAATVDAQGNEATASTQNPLAAVPANGLTCWSADMRYAVVTNVNRQQAEVYSVKPQRLLHTIPLSDFYSIYGTNYISVIWSPDNSQFYYTDGFSDDFIWDIQRKRQPYTFPPMVVPIAWSPDGQYIAAASDDIYDTSQRTFFLLRAADGKQFFQTSFADQYALSHIAWSPDSRYVVFPTTGNDNWLAGNPWSMEIWDSQTRKKVSEVGGTLPINQSGSSYYNLSGIVWSPDGAVIATGLTNDIWLSYLAYDQAGPRQIRTSILNAASDDNSTGNVLTWASDSRHLAVVQSGNQDASLKVYEIFNGRSVAVKSTASNPPGTIAALAWSADSRTITTADNANQLFTWKLG